MLYFNNPIVWLQVLAILGLEIACVSYNLPSQPINIPYNSFSFNSQTATQIYICTPYLQKDVSLITYLMGEGSNIFKHEQNLTYFIADKTLTTQCSNQLKRVNKNVTKFTNYYLAVAPYNPNFSGSLAYTTQVGTIIADTHFTKNFSGVLNNNGIYYSKTFSYDLCFNAYTLTITPPPAAPTIGIIVTRIGNSTSTTNYQMNSQVFTVSINYLSVNESWGYQFSYAQKTFMSIYNYTHQISLLTTNQTETEVCCNNTFSTLCNEIFNIPPVPPTPNTTDNDTQNNTNKNTATNTTTDTTTNTTKNIATNTIDTTTVNVGAIVGGSVGGIIFLSLLLTVGFYLCYRPRLHKQQQIAESLGTEKNIISQDNKPNQSQQHLQKSFDPEAYCIDKCAVCDKQGSCNIQCGFCKVKFHSACIQKWIKSGGNCPKLDCQKVGSFEQIIGKV